jgi:TPR repeat protein
MKKNWYQQLFGQAEKPDLQTTHSHPEGLDAEAQFHLGVIHSSSEGEGRNDAEAAQCYLKAANLNHPLAQFNLGLMYANGQGVVRNDGEAVMWIRRAADQGDAGAQFNLGSRCHRSSLGGQETEAAESKIESYKWFHLAAAQGYNQADAACERVTLDMSFEQVAEGDRRIAAFPEAGPKLPTLLSDPLGL